MKVIDTPRTNRIGNMVAYVSPYGQCYRALVVPRDPRSPAQLKMRQFFGSSSQGWGRRLSDLQRQRWDAAAQTVPTHPSLNQYSRLSGQQLWVKINSTLRCIGQPPVDEPPAPVVFGPNPVGELIIDYDPVGNLRLRLAVGTTVEDLMLSAETPRSAGRLKHRRVCYLGLLGSPIDGQCDITAAYIARFGRPNPGQKVFVVTCQHKNGWKSQDYATSAIVPPNPLSATPTKSRKAQPEAAARMPEAQTASD
jgi:hypothetical protein